jgi:hypothetical protein
LLARLKADFPFHSPRYAAHMIAEQTLPSIAAYFAAMLYNPNNVSSDAGPAKVTCVGFYLASCGGCAKSVRDVSARLAGTDTRFVIRMIARKHTPDRRIACALEAFGGRPGDTGWRGRTLIPATWGISMNFEGLRAVKGLETRRGRNWTLGRTWWSEMWRWWTVWGSPHP